MIAIAGGTGRLGTRVVERLHARGREVRVLTRDPDRARALPQTRVDVVRCDVRDRGAVESAVAGADTVVSAVHGFAGPGRVTPDSIDRAGNINLIEAARSAGADVVLMSVLGAAPDNPMDLHRAKYAAEQHLRASGVQWTIIRAAAFLELWTEIVGKAPVFGRGENPINFVAVDDVAAAVEHAVVDTSTRGRVIDVAGPENLTFNELAARVRQANGSRAAVRHVPRGMLRAFAPISRQARAALAMDTIDMTAG